MWVLVLFICCIAIGGAVIKTVRFFFPKTEPKPAIQNPYIQHQQVKKLNETWYSNYLVWMQKNDPEGVPVDKLQADEDIKANNKYKGLFN
jgi:hypothetical protein